MRVTRLDSIGPVPESAGYTAVPTAPLKDVGGEPVMEFSLSSEQIERQRLIREWAERSLNDDLETRDRTGRWRGFGTLHKAKGLAFKLTLCQDW
jgi:hypothetical protein